MKATKQKTSPIAVIINDVHYNLNTLELADEAMQVAINKANKLQVPLIVAGDLHDTKANMRAECVNRMLKTFSKVKECVAIRGNHDSLNEKSSEHALNFLPKEIRIIAGRPHRFTNAGPDLYLVPYYNNIEELRKELQQIPKGSTLIMHQGIEGSSSGEYIQDKSAIRPEDVAGMRVISGHYHTRQDIVLPDGGLWSYTGNPYTLNYAEANDPPKGFHILMDDGSLEFIPTNLRKHVKLCFEIDDTGSLIDGQGSDLIEDGDLVWVRVHGTKEQLSKFNKKQLGLEGNIRLDLIPLEPTASPLKQTIALTQTEQFDQLIDSLTNTSKEARKRLKDLWKAL